MTQRTSKWVTKFNKIGDVVGVVVGGGMPTLWMQWTYKKISFILTTRPPTQQSMMWIYTILTKYIYITNLSLLIRVNNVIQCTDTGRVTTKPPLTEITFGNIYINERACRRCIRTFCPWSRNGGFGVGNKHPLWKHPLNRITFLKAWQTRTHILVSKSALYKTWQPVKVTRFLNKFCHPAFWSGFP